jgi:diadenosine tetraphosphate (Ap4A) HIT family hydrolase
MGRAQSEGKHGRMTPPMNSATAAAMLAAAAASPAFSLDPRLEADTIPIGELALSAVLLLNDSRFPWLVLVPRRPDLTEVTDLAEKEAAALMGELRLAAQVMLELARPDKINIGALGNVVPQLHLHVVGRFRSDPAWPGPVWGFGTRRPYPDHAAAALVERAAGLFAAA